MATQTLPDKGRQVGTPGHSLGIARVKNTSVHDIWLYSFEV